MSLHLVLIQASELLAEGEVGMLEYFVVNSLRVKISFLMVLLFSVSCDWNIDLSTGTSLFSTIIDSTLDLITIMDYQLK